MKTFINCLLLFGAVGCGFSQKNNPQNKIGTDFVTSYNIVKKDYNAGKIIELNQATLDYYSAATPIKAKITVNDAAQILSGIKNATLSDVLTNAKLSTFSKEAISRAVAGADIVRIVIDVKSRPLATSEKHIVLGVLAIIYNGNASPSLNEGARHGLFWAILGGVTGGALFGPAGILVGAAIGGMAGEATP